MTEEEKSDLIQKKIRKAHSFISQINDHIQFGYFDTAVNRIYYASFYAVQALLAKENLFPKTHKGVLNQFVLNFIKKEKIPAALESFYPRILDLRFLADYGTDELPDIETVKSLLAKAIDFIHHIEKLLEEK